MEKRTTNPDTGGTPLEWSSANKAFFILLVTGLIYLAYNFWGRTIPQRPDIASLVNHEWLAMSLTWLDHILVITAVLLCLVRAVPWRWRNSIWLEHLGAQFYSLSLSMIGYFSGTLAISTGVILAGAPVFGFMFLRRGPVLTALVVAIALQIGLTLAQVKGALPYAPMVESLTTDDGRLSAFWVFTFYLFALPHFVVLTTLSWLILTRWRQREEETRQLSMTDSLTGLLNRRAILAHLRREQEHCRDHKLSLSVLMVDLDHFKKLNDTWGHHLGDQALVAAARALRCTLRQSDQVGRYGGEEFLLVLTGTDCDGAMILAERLRTALEDIELATGGEARVALSGSFGLYFCEPGEEMDASEMVRLADEALYEAKARGRNQVVVAAPLREKAAAVA